MGSDTLIIIGIALLAVSIIHPLVTLVVDNTPPKIEETLPSNGGVYTSLTKIVAYVYDYESGVKSVTCVIDGVSYNLYRSTIQPLAVAQMDSGSGEYWERTVSITTPGTHTFEFTATNKAGLSSKVSGTFTIYTDLQGKWYINDQEITSSSQTIYSTSLTVTFKFVKTAGIDDSYISCWVEEGGTKILTLTLTDSSKHVWTGVYTFKPGTHTLTLKVSDGRKTLTLSIVNLTIPEATPTTTPGATFKLTTQQTVMLLGGLLVAVGLLLKAKER